MLPKTLLPRLLIASTLLLVLPSCWGLIPGQPTFCIAYCNKCGDCASSNPGFQDDDCQATDYSGYDVYAEFDYGWCMEHCLEGSVPGHPMPPSWQGWSCEVFDDFL